MYSCNYGYCESKNAKMLMQNLNAKIPRKEGWQKVIKNKLSDADIEMLSDAILKLENKEECKLFLNDLLTIAEMSSIIQRWQVAYMLDNDETYGKIAEATGASTATISRVKRALNYGADGYRLILDRLKEE